MEKAQNFAADQVKSYGLTSKREIAADNEMWPTHPGYL